MMFDIQQWVIGLRFMRITLNHALSSIPRQRQHRRLPPPRAIVVLFPTLVYRKLPQRQPIPEAQQIAPLVTSCLLFLPLERGGVSALCRLVVVIGAFVGG